jgi:hypothetical protein
MPGLFFVLDLRAESQIRAWEFEARHAPIELILLVSVAE